MAATDQGDGSALALWSRLICNPIHERADRELSAMPQDERTRVFADIGGAQEINPEDPEFVARSLRALNESLSKITTKNAFDQAQKMDRQYIDNPSFRLMFLRADNFDVDGAALRIVRHFESKLELFGPDKLARDITLEDLTADDMDALMTGGLQILPHADQFGRLILFSRQVVWRYKTRENQLRAMWYIVMSTFETEDVQRRGIVGLGYSVGEVRGWSSDYELIRRIVNLLGSLPARMLAIYTCFNSRMIETVVDVVINFFNSFLRARFRALLGTKQECDYQLMLMGITYTDVPVGNDGTILLANLTKWLDRRRQIEHGRMRR